MRTIPIDSTGAREQRELEEELSAEAAAAAHGKEGPKPRPDADFGGHDERCRAGWLGEDVAGRPIPCLACRPHLGAAHCRTCDTSRARCRDQRALGHGMCCGSCEHSMSRTPLPSEGRDQHHGEAT